MLAMLYTAIEQNHDKSLNFRKMYGNYAMLLSQLAAQLTDLSFTPSDCRQHINGTNYFRQSTKVDSETFVGLQAITLLKYSNSVIVSASYCFLKEPSLESNLLIPYVQLMAHNQGHFFLPPPPPK
jgi:hypothetical protein